MQQLAMAEAIGGGVEDESFGEAFALYVRLQPFEAVRVLRLSYTLIHALAQRSRSRQCLRQRFIVGVFRRRVLQNLKEKVRILRPESN